jgi:hypothetical protein
LKKVKIDNKTVNYSVTENIETTRVVHEHVNYSPRVNNANSLLITSLDSSLQRPVLPRIKTKVPHTECKRVNKLRLNNVTNENINNNDIDHIRKLILHLDREK